MHAIDDRLRFGVQGATERRQACSGLTALEQGAAEFALQTLDLLAQRRLRDVHALGRLAEMQQFAERGESA